MLIFCRHFIVVSSWLDALASRRIAQQVKIQIKTVTSCAERNSSFSISLADRPIFIAAQAKDNISANRLNRSAWCMEYIEIFSAGKIMRFFNTKGSFRNSILKHFRKGGDIPHCGDLGLSVALNWVIWSVKISYEPCCMSAQTICQNIKLKIFLRKVCEWSNCNVIWTLYINTMMIHHRKAYSIECKFNPFQLSNKSNVNSNASYEIDCTKKQKTKTLFATPNGLTSATF